MDMEADLGIDSIKRVEILGAMQEKYPQLPAIDPAALSDMRTLEQIIHYMTSTAPQSDHTEPAPTAVPHVSETKVVLSQGSAISSNELKDTLIAIVSEKTGYPSEMLETDMDMEADLGIDSIKRVEILGAMQEKFPELPSVEAAALSEMHTLQQIIDAFSGLDLAAGKNQENNSQNDEIASLEESPLPRGYVNLKAIPLPDRLNVNLPKETFTLLTNDGTGLTPNVALNLIREGHKVAVLRLAGISPNGSQPLPDGIDSIDLKDNSETTLTEALNSLKSKHGRISVLIHLDPTRAGNSSLSAHEQTILKSVFLLAKHVAGDLSESALKGFSAFMTVTHLDGQFGLSQDNSSDPVSGGLFGLTKTVSLEWDDVFCRAVDLKPGLDDKTSAEMVVNELYDPNRLLTETGYTELDRFTLVVEQPVVEGAV